MKSIEQQLKDQIEADILAAGQAMHEQGSVPTTVVIGEHSIDAMRYMVHSRSTGKAMFDFETFGSDDDFWRQMMTPDWQKELQDNRAGYVMEAIARGFSPGEADRMYRELTVGSQSPYLFYDTTVRTPNYQQFNRGAYKGGRKNDHIKTHLGFQRGRMWTQTLAGSEHDNRWIYNALKREWNVFWNGTVIGRE